MLVPAILYKEQIRREFQKYFHTTDMMYATGCIRNWIPEIAECPGDWQFQFAIVDTNKNLIGYLEYSIDWYASKAFGFDLFSFNRKNALIGRDVFNKLEELVKTMHRVEWKAIGGNPACKSYDTFIKKHNGTKYVLKDSIKDRNGVYRDCIIYEIVSSH